MSRFSKHRKILAVLFVIPMALLFTSARNTNAQSTVSFTFTLQEASWELRPNMVLTGLYLFSNGVAEPTLPGPAIRVHEGDLVELTVTNMLNEPHTLIFPELVNSGSEVLELLSGETKMFRFTANKPGTFFYAGKTPEERDRGMYGAIIVLSPYERQIPPNLDYIEFYDEIPRDWQDTVTTVHGDPDHQKPTYATHEFILNGKTIDSKVKGNNLEVNEIFAKIGQTLVIRTISIGSETHAPHVHSHLFHATDNGLTTLGDQPAPTTPTDVVRMPSLYVRNLYLTARAEGSWPLHCHVETHLLNNKDADYPGGMFTFLEVGRASQNPDEDKDHDDKKGNKKHRDTKKGKTSRNKDRHDD